MEIKSDFLEKYEAKVTSQGILINEIYYTCYLALKEKWFEQVLCVGPWTLPAFIDPCDPGEALLHLLDGRLMLIKSIEKLSEKTAHNHADILEYQTAIRLLKSAYKKRYQKVGRNRCYYL